MNKLNVIISTLLLVLLMPFVLAQSSLNETETLIENQTEITTENTTEITAENTTEIATNESYLNETYENETICSANAQRTCDIIAELGIKEGQNVPFVLPKNGALNMKFFDDTLIGYFEINSGLISNIVCCEEHPEPTHTVKIINLDAVEEIKNSEDFLNEANQKLTEGEITISSSGFMNNARLSIGKAFIRIASWFN